MKNKRSALIVKYYDISHSKVTCRLKNMIFMDKPKIVQTLN
ncbi:MAG: hypothetical protein OES15_00690 [Nitrosopumilus sp.]|nr:hypothetical protein [Nitrosopumilus sp.]MDH3852830.1 hypothetical protein [Nitrosopumilus sp.]